MYDSRNDTIAHIHKVGSYLTTVINEFKKRILQHDSSKLLEPEKPIFDKFTPLLKNSTYGSEEYKSFLVEMQAALKHHYEHNRHHPEHFENGIKDMSLIDLLEMICDWIAASERHSDGDVYKSIDMNKERFGYSEEFTTILKNTVKQIKGE